MAQLTSTSSSELPNITQQLSPHTIHAMLLVAGTCIGGGMLALPVVCGASGFWPSIAFMGLTWIMMTTTALCLVEVGFWMKKEDAHIVSMSKKMLGPFGRWLSWGLFLFISYASLIAYTGGSGHLIADAIAKISQGAYTPSNETGCYLFMLIFGPFIFLSHHALGRANSALFFAMIASYIVIVSMGIQYVDLSLLHRMSWTDAPKAVPFLLTSFSFQTMVPSLHSYVHHNRRSLQIAIIGGTTIAFSVYALWQFVALGSISYEGKFGLLDAYENAQPATYCLIHATKSPFLSGLALFFAFFSLVTSFFGIAMGLYDFLSDGLSLSKDNKGNCILGTLVLLPSLFFAIYYEGAFLTALDISGGFGDTILNGLIPIVMIWIGWQLYMRRALTLQTKAGLSILALLYIMALTNEIVTRL